MTPFIVSEYVISLCQYDVASHLIRACGGRVSTAAASKNAFTATAIRQTAYGSCRSAEEFSGIMGGTYVVGDVTARRTAMSATSTETRMAHIVKQRAIPPAVPATRRRVAAVPATRTLWRPADKIHTTLCEST
eukprot:299294-Prymnesium_polylepis.1